MGNREEPSAVDEEIIEEKNAEGNIELSNSENKIRDDERNVVQPDDFPTLELTLEEARRQYDDEERRRDTVENKIGIVVTVDALLISFATLFSRSLDPYHLTLVLAIAMASAGLGLWAIRSRDYDRPGKRIENFHEYSAYDNSGSQQEQLLLDYEEAIRKNKSKNDPKFKYFNWCIALTFASLVFLLAIPIIQNFSIYLEL